MTLTPAWRSADALFDSWLRDWLFSPASSLETGPECRELMTYSLYSKSKHVRPVLHLLALGGLGRPLEQGRAAALALECVHTYSLVHDDLPCMDDDDVRRGQPSSHKRFDEGRAVLAGDALLTLAFELLGTGPSGVAGPQARILARAAGAAGMVRGQVLDLAAEGRPGTLADLDLVHELKTGALIGASLALAGPAAGLPEARTADLDRFGRLLGRIFQTRDDILDVEGAPEETGKSRGKDEAGGKLTAVSVLGLAGARARLAALDREAREALAGLPLERAEFSAVLDYLASRRS